MIYISLIYYRQHIRSSKVLHFPYFTTPEKSVHCTWWTSCLAWHIYIMKWIYMPDINITLSLMESQEQQISKVTFWAKLYMVVVAMGALNGWLLQMHWFTKMNTNAPRNLPNWRFTDVSIDYCISNNDSLCSI